MKIKAIHNSNCTTEYHKAECSHSKGIYHDHAYEIEVEASNIKELIHKLELELNSDFAGDYGLTPEEYVASGEGYRIYTTKGADFRLFPCVKI